MKSTVHRSTEKSFFKISLAKSLGFVLLFATLLIGMMFAVAPDQAIAAGGAYTIDFSAADPAVNSAPYLPTYDRVSPPYPVPEGRASDPLPNAVFGNPKDAVNSLAPEDMALGQIVPFEVKITVNGSTDPEGGVISFTGGWSTVTTSGNNFGYDPAFMVYAAFVDYGDPATNDPGGNAKVDSFSPTLVGNEIQGTITVSGLDSGDSVIVEVWLVLKSTLPDKVGGNVASRLVSAQTSTGDTISTGNQTVPLLQVGKFESATADVGITKSDNPDPVNQGENVTYTITATNHSATTVANGVLITDTLDSNVTFVSASDGGVYDSTTREVTWPATYIAAGGSIERTLTVSVNMSAPTENIIGTDPHNGGTTLPSTYDINNKVEVETTVSDDPNATNNTYYQPTNVLMSTTSVTVSKTWIGPAGSATINLLADGTKVDEHVFTSDGSFTFENLPMYDAETGELIEYTVTEDPIPGYISTREGNDFTNTYLTGCLVITKDWEEGYPEEYVLPAVTVDVTGPFEYSRTITLNEDNDWTFTICDIPVGQYSVKEQPIKGWVSRNNGPVTVVSDASAVITITNTMERYCDTAWAYGNLENWDYTSSNNWGWSNGPLEIGTHEYPVYAGAGQNDPSNGAWIGNVTVSYDGSYVIVTFEPFDGVEIKNGKVWIGDTPLPANKGKKNQSVVMTNAPGQFPYKIGQSVKVKNAWKGVVYVAVHFDSCRIAIYDYPAAVQPTFEPVTDINDNPEELVVPEDLGTPGAPPEGSGTEDPGNGVPTPGTETPGPGTGTQEPGSPGPGTDNPEDVNVPDNDKKTPPGQAKKQNREAANLEEIIIPDDGKNIPPGQVKKQK